MLLKREQISLESAFFPNTNNNCTTHWLTLSHLHSKAARQKSFYQTCKRKRMMIMPCYSKENRWVWRIFFETTHPDSWYSECIFPNTNNNWTTHLLTLFNLDSKAARQKSFYQTCERKRMMMIMPCSCKSFIFFHLLTKLLLSGCWKEKQ